MGFNEEYSEIKLTVKDELELLEKEIPKLFDDENPLEKQLLGFLTNNPKRLRPLLGILFSKCAFGEVSKNQIDALLAVELIHNATLIHDDVIDNASVRRQSETLNCQFDNNLAVVAGDFLLSVAMEKIINLNSVDVIKLCTSALKKTCLGEINQYFNKYKITNIQEYLKKSEEKTALLFEIAVLTCVMLSSKASNEEIESKALDFAKNFGIAFQIRDDLLNFLSEDIAMKKDFTEGIYTAPVIFAYEENNLILSSENIVNSVKIKKGIEKTKDLMDNYFNNAVSAIESLDNNFYKTTILNLMEVLRSGF